MPSASTVNEPIKVIDYLPLTAVQVTASCCPERGEESPRHLIEHLVIKDFAYVDNRFIKQPINRR